MDSTLALLTAWVPDQRWYESIEGHRPALRVLADVDLPSTDPAARVRRLFLADDAPGRTLVYQVPVVERSGGTLSPHLIGRIGDRALIDGPHDRAFTDALLASVVPGAAPAAARVLTGEQSNTSIVFTPDGGDPPLICKMYRRVEPGRNPDIVLQSALSAAGSPSVPRCRGDLTGHWPDPARPGVEVGGALAFVQEFFPDVQDAWLVAREHAAEGVVFEDEARALGSALAHVHRQLAELFPAVPATRENRAQIVGDWHARLDATIAEVPELATDRTAIRAVYARAEQAGWPPLQFIHGDFHLGQVISVPGRGWVILDFEGEPLRPMSERMRPDLPLRDVAGMLRSFDYVAGSLDPSGRDRRPRAWAAATRGAFLAGYAAGGHPMRIALLDALELDKAVYEVLYEARHRPTWLPLPRAAVQRLSMGGSTGAR